MIAFLLALIIMILVGALIVDGLLNDKFNSRFDFTFDAKHLMIVSLGTGLGLGIGSCLHFLLLLASPGSVAPLWFATETVALVLLCVMRLKGTSAPSPGLEAIAPEPLNNSWTRFLLPFLLFLFCLSSISFWSQSWAHPHSDWDALMIWNVRARFLERIPIDFANTFSSAIFWSHPDYPLLLPSLISFALGLTNENQIAANAIAYLFTVGTAALLASSLTVFKSRVHGSLAGIVLLTTPFWTNCGASMLADVPLAFYFLATIVCCSSYDKGKRLSSLLLAGCFASMAAWTKNEGLLFIPIVLTASAIVYRRFISSKPAAMALLGALPVLLLLLWFKINLAPLNDLVAGQDAVRTSARLTNPERFLTVAKFFTVYLVTFGSWIVSPVPLFAIYWFLSRSRMDNLSAIRAALVVIMMIIGYAAVFILTPTDLVLHLQTAARRLLLQLWPLAIFAVLAVLSLSATKPASTTGDAPS